VLITVTANIAILFFSKQIYFGLINMILVSIKIVLANGIISTTKCLLPPDSKVFWKRIIASKKAFRSWTKVMHQ